MRMLVECANELPAGSRDEARAPTAHGRFPAATSGNSYRTLPTRRDMMPVLMTGTRFPEARAPRGMVATPHLLATQSGVAALRAGGNALDAAIAAAATIAVVYPHMNGLGGDNVWLIHDAGRGVLRALRGLGRSAQAASVAWYAARGIDAAIPSRGGAAALTVPGVVDGWWSAHEYS